MWIFIWVILVLAVGFVGGLMVGRKNPKVAEVVGSTVDKEVIKIEDKIKK